MVDGGSEPPHFARPGIINSQKEHFTADKAEVTAKKPTSGKHS
jgi:hypothetical protein